MDMRPISGQEGRSVKPEFRRQRHKHIYIRLHPDHHTKLKARAKEEGISVSCLIRRAVVSELNDTRLRRIRHCIDTNGKHETGDC